MLSINYTAPINPLGYGVVGTQLLLAMKRAKINVRLWPIGNVDCEHGHVTEIQECLDNRHSYNLDDDSIRVWHQFDLAQHIGKGKRFGFPIFELDKFLPIEVAEISRMDKVVVCSEWAKDIVLGQCEKLRYEDVIVTPLGVDRTVFNEHVGEADPQWTTFLAVGKWEYRKGHDIIAEAFSKAFSPRDRVRLWMLTHNPFLSPQQHAAWHSLYKSTIMADKVSFLPRAKTRADVANIMAQADCGLFPARAEGWNLEALEMMAMGKQVIATDYAGHTQFCTRRNSLLIGVDKMEVAKDGVFFDGKGGGRWAHLGEPQVDQLVQHMRSVHKNKSEVGINIEGVNTSKELTWDNTFNKLQPFLSL
jgi:glycosyltransferase involved in cell wall biosynthesis